MKELMMMKLKEDEHLIWMKKLEKLWNRDIYFMLKWKELVFPVLLYSLYYLIAYESFKWLFSGLF